MKAMIFISLPQLGLREDIIVIDPYLKAEHNDYIVVCIEEWEATFKQLKKYGKIRVLHPLKAKYEDIELSKNTESLG